MKSPCHAVVNILLILFSRFMVNVSFPRSDMSKNI